MTKALDERNAGQEDNFQNVKKLPKDSRVLD
jgi:hypothetical protein